MVLVPATMELLGDANWWLPDWLGHRLPRFHLEVESTASLDAELDDLITESEGLSARRS
jgi:RND superfamily putative drug exporter